MKRYTLVCLYSIIIILGFVSCGSSIEMMGSKTFHFEGADLTLAVPKGWNMDVFSYEDNGKVATIKVGQDVNLKNRAESIVFYIRRPEDDVNNFLPAFDEKNCMKYGNYYVYIPPYPADSDLHEKSGALYIEPNKSFGLFLENVPKNKVTLELEAIFNSLKIEEK